MIRLTSLMLFLATPALAQQAITGAEFEQRYTGQSLAFVDPGAPPFATSLIGPGQSVTTVDDAGQCYYGSWYENERGEICFAYPGTDDACWLFYPQSGSGLRGVYPEYGYDYDYKISPTGVPNPCG